MSVCPVSLTFQFYVSFAVSDSKEPVGFGLSHATTDMGFITQTEHLSNNPSMTLFIFILQVTEWEDIGGQA